MKKKIRKVAILGSGTMGSGIAAQLANTGIRSYLLDIVPKELTEQEKAKGLTLESPAFRNRIAESNKALLLKAKPAALMDKEDADLITVGNMDDNLDWLMECDWIVEVVPENLVIKKMVLNKIAPFIKPQTIVSSNTSSISINSIAADMPLEFRQHWLGTHFFNPVRYMKLLEIIPGQDTLPEIVDFMADFGEVVLGKGIVLAKDTPAFVANRLGNLLAPSASRLMAELGLNISEVDALTGTAIGRPRTGSFGLMDLVGLDIAVASTGTVRDNVEDPAEIELYTLPLFFQEMVNKGMLGNKTGAGFYKRAGKDKLVLNLESMEYVPAQPVEFSSLEAAQKEKTLAGKLEAFFEGNDKAAQFVWKNIKTLFLYAASKIPEVSDDILNMDRGLCWGYNHAAGPFELWSGLDLPKYVSRMEAEGDVVPAWVKEMIASGITSFYKSEGGIDYYYSIPDKKFVPIGHKAEMIVLKELKGRDQVVLANDSGTLYDIGDGVVCLQFHGRPVAINNGMLEIMRRSQEELARNWEGMVICAEGKNFCVGANLQVFLELARAKNWDGIEKILALGHIAYDTNKYSEKPVVIAVHGKALGGGCEIVTQSSAIQADADSSIGQVEPRVGLIPGGGGLKEAVVRTVSRIKGTKAAPVDVIAPYFENILTSRVSANAKEAIQFGYFRPTDRITINNDFLVSDAKKRVLELVAADYKPPVKRAFPAFGQNALASLKIGSRQLFEAGKISEYDWYIACRMVDVLAGGGVIAGTMITEEYLEALEREVFISLCGEQKTQDRITYMLTTGKALQN